MTKRVDRGVSTSAMACRIVFRVHIGVLCCVLAATLFSRTVVGEDAPIPIQDAKQALLRIPGEFEKQRAIVLSVSDWQPHHRQVLAQIVDKTAGHIDLLLLHNSMQQRDEAIRWLDESKSATGHVYFLQLELDTIWVRDFAPIFGQVEGNTKVLDFYYYGGARPKDEHFPHRWVERAGGELMELRWTVQGGNFLSNGQHTMVTTTKIYDENRIEFPRPLRGQDSHAEGRRILTQDLLKQCDLQSLVILNPLQSEQTKHVDMFATFVSSQDIVVASLDPRTQSSNAAILDRNAATLEKLQVGEKKLRVHRLPIPSPDGTSWSALTNVLFANDLLLIPKFASDPPEYLSNAKNLYGRLLPNTEIEVVDITSMKQLQGALHCLSAHIPSFVDLPQGSIRYDEAVRSTRP